MTIKQFIKFAFAASMALWGAACMRDAETSPDGSGSAPDGKVKVTLPLDMADFKKPVVTRAGTTPNPNETEVDHAVVFVFEGEEREDAVFAEAAWAEIGDFTMSFALTPRTDPVWIAVIANPWTKSTLQALGSTADAIVEVVNSEMTGRKLGFVDSADTTYDMLDQFWDVYPAFLNYISLESIPLPMSAYFKSSDGVNSGMQPPGGILKLTRATAKVTVESQDDDFVPVSMILYNTPERGRFFRFSDDIPDLSDDNIYTNLYDPELVEPGTEMALYPFEAPKTNLPLLFLTALYKGTEYTYILPFNDTDGNPVDIVRNKHYKFVIDEGSEGIYGFDIESGNLAGYLEMISQVDFQIDVTDMSGHTTISNGDYFLGVSNDELLVMAETNVPLNNIHAVTVTTNFSYEWNVSDRHLYENGAMIVGNDTYCLNLPQPGDIESTDIMISLPANVNTGKLTIRVGNLEKAVTIRRVSPYSYSEKGYLLGTDILHAEIDKQGKNDWLRGFSTAEESGSAVPVLTRSTKGPVYMQTKNWKGLRDASFYYTSEGGGRTKVMASVRPDFDKSSPNCYMLEPGETVDIPVEKAFAIWADPKIMTNEYELFCSGETAEVLWQDVPAAGFIVPELIESGEPNEYVIRVTAPSPTEGNAVVVFKSEGEIRWSWHIWVTEDKDIVNAGAGTGNQWMDRNIGALINSYNANRQGDVAGLNYQYGRKDPFPGAIKANLSTAKTFYDPQCVAKPILISENACTIEESITDPCTYYHVGTSIGDWSKELINNNYLWRDPYTSTSNPERVKSIFDPCPKGWMVPRSADWTGTQDNEWGGGLAIFGRHNDAYGGYYPVFGHSSPRKINTVTEYRVQENLGSPNSFNYYATATSSSTIGCYILMLRNEGLETGRSIYRYIGTPIRCIRHIL